MTTGGEVASQCLTSALIIRVVAELDDGWNRHLCWGPESTIAKDAE